MSVKRFKSNDKTNLNGVGHWDHELPNGSEQRGDILQAASVEWNIRTMVNLRQLSDLRLPRCGQGPYEVVTGHRRFQPSMVDRHSRVTAGRRPRLHVRGLEEREGIVLRRRVRLDVEDDVIRVLSAQCFREVQVLARLEEPGLDVMDFRRR